MSTTSKSPIGSAELRQIEALASLLRENGDKVLSATSKLSLSTALLGNLNEAFALIVDDREELECSFRVCNSSKVDVFADLKFLHDIIQKTISLKITRQLNEPNTTVDLTKFRHLRHLVLQKVSVDLVRGLQSIRGQLETVVCSGGQSVGSVGRLLAACGGDAGVGFVWGSLRLLALPYNALARIDKSLELAPWLQTLDLSHNLISSAVEIDCLPNLKNANLGYNKLEKVPIFNRVVFHALHVLVLNNNYIDNLSGLRGLEALSELDLSYNCLIDHSTLWPLETMSVLSWVSLEGNPLSYHPQHRLLSIKHLHPSLADSKFILDNAVLSKLEKQIVAENRTFTIRSLRSESSEDYLASLTSSMTSDVTSGSMETSISNEPSIHQNQTWTNSDGDRTGNKLRKKRNVKRTVISDEDLEKREVERAGSLVSNIETSTDHLDMKKRMLELREKFGEDNWLHSHAGTFVQDIMGLPPASRPPLASTPVLPITNVRPPSKSEHSESSRSPIEEPSFEPIVGTKVEIGTNLEVGVTDDSDGIEEIVADDVDELVNDILTVTTSESETEAYNPDEEEGNLYLVQRKKQDGVLEELFLVVTPEDLKERDWRTGKVTCRWATDTVLSCVMGRGETTTVNIIFDTTRRDRQNRTYIMKFDDAKELVSTVSETTNARRITLRIFKCMKCSTHFSEDVDHTTVTSVFTSDIRAPKCPTCDSNLFIQINELSTPELEMKSNTKEVKDEQIIRNVDLHHSGSYSSIGSATSLNHSRESTPSTGTVTKKYESDIEVLSNPSQSSIEVLEDSANRTHQYATPSRKRVTEDNQATNNQSLLVISDMASIAAVLTESSSSGSLTDSVCTAYENRVGLSAESNTSITNDKSTMNRNYGPSSGEIIEEKVSNTGVTNLTSMLGGLLQSMKITSTKLSPPLSDTDTAWQPGIAASISSNRNVIQYSYTDYRNVDHRLKLHVILNIFDHEKEDLVLLLRAEILTKGSTRTFPGCLVLSTSKVYLLRIIGPEGEDPQQWLQKEFSWTMDRLRTIAPLPYKQGLLVELHQPRNVVGEGSSTATLLCILQDFQRTSNFLSYLTDLPLPGSCEVEFSVSERSTSLIRDLATSSKYHQTENAIRLLAIFSSCVIKSDGRDTCSKIAGLLVTISSLIIIQDNLQWLIPDSNEMPLIRTEQAMSNLIEVEHHGEKLVLNFLDEEAGSEESWNLVFVSSSAVDTVINSIRPPWEDLFSVPLQVTSTTTANPTADQIA